MQEFVKNFYCFEFNWNLAKSDSRDDNDFEEIDIDIEREL